MAYWAAVRFLPKYEKLALHFLGLSGFETYCPRLRKSPRIIRGRKITLTPPLFPGYCFVLITLQWHAVRWAPGTIGLVMNGGGPAHVPDNVITEIRSRERDGLVVLPKLRGLRRGDQVRITSGVFGGQCGIYAGQRPRDRVAVLLTLLGGQQRVSLSREAIEPG